jgi:hypothetical protein
MNVLTKNPIIVASNGYSNYTSSTGAMAAGAAATSKTPSTSDIEKAKKEGFDWDKATGTWKKVQESGALDYLASLFGKKNQQPTQAYYGSGTNYQPPVVPVDTKEKGMSTGMKVGLAIGGIAVVGAIIYFATRKK